MAPNVEATSAADRWFLHRGLPSAVPRKARWRHVVPRSAPALVAFAVLMVLSLVVMIASGDSDVDVDADPSASQWLALVVLASIPPATLTSGHCVSRISGNRGRWIASGIAIPVAVASDWYGDGGANLARDTLVDVTIVAVILIATGTGIGSILGWSARVTFRQLRSAGRLMARALPVVLLTVLVFFNTLVWTIATDLDATRMSLLIGFLALIAVSFLVSGIRDLLPTVTGQPQTDGLVDTPFAELDDGDTPALKLGERVNLALVVTISQVTQMLVLACVTGAVFFTMGLIVLNEKVSDKLTGGAPVQSVWLDITLPVSVAHLHVTALLTVLTFMYVSVRAVGDGEYRKEFLDPLFGELRLALAARHRYRAMTG